MRVLEFILAIFYILLLISLVLLVLVLVIPVGILVALYFVFFKKKKVV